MRRDLAEILPRSRRDPTRAWLVRHSGANPILVRSSRGTGFYFVSVFHTKDQSLQYHNYAYTFAAEPPFEITAVSRRPLTLRGKRVRFVSSLSFLGHHRGAEPVVGLSYGADDAEGRFAVLPLRLLLRDLVHIKSLSIDESAGGRRGTSDDGGGSTTRRGVGGGERDGGRGGASGGLERLQLPSEAAAAVAMRLRDATTRKALSVGKVSDGLGACFLLRDVRFDAPSIKSVKAATPQQCCALCRDVTHCVGFSWSPYNGGE